MIDYTCKLTNFGSSISTPEYKSQVCINGDWSVSVMLTSKKPNTIHRFMQKLFLGIEWRDYNA